MRYKLFGNSGLRVTELALGTMTFGEDWGWGASKEVSRKIFDAYVNAGGNFIDTSVNYTNGSAAQFSGLACSPPPSFLGLSRAGFSAYGLISLRRYRLGSTSPAVRQTQTLWSSARKEQRRPSLSAVNTALRGLAPMGELPFSSQPSRFPATRSR